MKKIFALLLCVMLLISTVPSLATELLYGDVVTDGVLNNDDVDSLKRYIAGYTSVNYDASTLELADVNQDGAISSADLLALIKLIPDYKPTQKEGPVIILKCDDFKANDIDTINAFEAFYNMVQEEGVAASFGIMGYSTATASAANKAIFWENAKKYVDNGIEIWSHGWRHKKSDTGVAEYDGYYTLEENREGFGKVLDMVKENTGYEITTFGAPFNRMNQENADMIEETYPQIKTIFFSEEEYDNVTTLNASLPESALVSLESFKTTFSTREKSNYYVMQIHPANYDETKLGEVRKVIKYLKSEGCKFMTPSQYTEYAKTLPEEEPEEEEPQIVIFKFDDLGINTYKVFDKTHELLKEEGVTNISFGVIGKNCVGDDTTEYWQYVNKFINEGVEIWNHGKEHLVNGDTASEFSGAYNYNTMKENVAFTQNIVKENTGYQITTVGSPGNAYNEEFAQMLNVEFPEINKVFFSENRGFNAFKIDKKITIESSTEGVTYARYEAAYRADYPYMVIQIHPNRLNKYNNWDDFRLVIRDLKAKGCVFMTPSQYYDYMKK